MPPRMNKEGHKKRELRRHKAIAEDERGWAGQRGRRPANEEEKNYRPAQTKR